MKHRVTAQDHLAAWTGAELYADIELDGGAEVAGAELVAGIELDCRTEIVGIELDDGTEVGSGAELIGAAPVREAHRSEGGGEVSYGTRRSSSCQSCVGADETHVKMKRPDGLGVRFVLLWLLNHINVCNAKGYYGPMLSSFYYIVRFIFSSS